MFPPKRAISKRELSTTRFKSENSVIFYVTSGTTLTVVGTTLLQSQDYETSTVIVSAEIAVTAFRPGPRNTFRFRCTPVCVASGVRPNRHILEVLASALRGDRDARELYLAWHCPCQ